jgi:hypothetical protein
MLRSRAANNRAAHPARRPRAAILHQRNIFLRATWRAICRTRHIALWPAFPTSEYYDALRLPLDRPNHFPGSPVIGRASLPAAHSGGVKTALPGSHDDRSHVQRPLRRWVPQRPLLEQERFPWPSPSRNRLGTLWAPPQRRDDPLTTLTQASLTLQTARSLHPRVKAARSRTGLRYQGPRRLPGPDSHRRAGLNLSLLRHAVLLFLMAPEQSRRTS